MASFRCPDCGSTHDIFGAGGGEAFAAENDLPFLGSIPLDPSVRDGGDGGEPIVLDDGDTADAFRVTTETTADMAGVVRRREASRRNASAGRPPQE
jgi:ATP-binding protein involved in chromosome partitioning